MYFPKSQIKPNLYTNGGEYILSTTKQNYIGYYYEVSIGQRFTGKTPQDGPNVMLLPTNKSQYKNPTPSNITNSFPIELANEESNLNYFSLLKTPSNTRSLPQPNPTFPTPQEQNLGVYTRYFCKKNNELKYMEIDKTTFDKLKTKTKDIAWDLYTPISTLWYLQFNSENINKNLVSQIEQKQNWYGFTQWFQEKF